MIKRVYGKLDGVDIILRQEEDGKWAIPVPFDTDGMYIFEIIAEDDAGNTAFLTKMLFVVNKADIKTYLISLDYPGELVEAYNIQLLPDEFRAELRHELVALCLSNLYLVEVLP